MGNLLSVFSLFLSRVAVSHWFIIEIDVVRSNFTILKCIMNYYEMSYFLFQYREAIRKQGFVETCSNSTFSRKPNLKESLKVFTYMRRGRVKGIDV